MCRSLTIAGCILLPKNSKIDGVLTLENGIIASVQKRSSFKGKIDIDMRKCIIGPGFIDIHVHGGGGNDFMSGNEQEVIEALRFHSAHGTTGILPTTVTAPESSINTALFSIRKVSDWQRKIWDSTSDLVGENTGAEIVGVHLEGPYINCKRKGGQDPKWIRPPSLKEFQKWNELVPCKMITLAPEIEGAYQFMKYVSENFKIPISAGHTDATLEEIKKAVALGLSHLTHYFNAMGGLHHREPGVVGAGMMLKELTVEIIADGIHVDPDLVKWVCHSKGINNVALVTDAVSFCGLQDGTYRRNEQIYHVNEGSIRMPDKTLAGSNLTMDQAVKNVCNFGIPLQQVWMMATDVPARIVGISNRKGSIEVGKDADITVLNEDFSVELTLVKGNKVYCKP